MWALKFFEYVLISATVFISKQDGSQMEEQI